MSKQTALQWYRQQMMAVLSTRDSETRHMTEGQIFDQALAMEREQIKEAYSTGLRYGMAHYIVEVTDEEADPANYYQRTYGKEADNGNG